MITLLCLDTCSMSVRALVSHHFYWNMPCDESEGLFQGLSWSHDFLALAGYMLFGGLSSNHDNIAVSGYMEG